MFISGTFKVKAGLAQMAKGGIIMDVTNPEEARIAEEAGVSYAIMGLAGEITPFSSVVDRSPHFQERIYYSVFMAQLLPF